MNVLMISLDRKAFEEGNPARMRIAEYGAIFNELHIIVYAKKSLGLSRAKIADNVWLYPTNSQTRFGYIRDAIRIAQELAKETTFAVVSSQDPSETGIAGYRVSRILAIPFHTQDHADVFDRAYVQESIGNYVRSLIARRLLPKADGIRTVSERSQKHLLARLPQLSSKLFLLPVYTEIDSLRERAPSFALRDRYPQFGFTLLAVGRFVPQKNLDRAVRVTAALIKKYPTAGLILVGEGPLEQTLKERAHALGIGAHVVFVPWQQDLVSYYKTANLFLMTSEYESYGRTLIEAAACGLPFVSTDVGIASMLADAGAGVVCERKSATCFVDHAYHFLNDNRERSLHSTKGYAAALALNGGSKQEYLARYKEMMERCLSSRLK